MSSRVSDSIAPLTKRIGSVLPFAALALMAVLLWLPFGFHIGFFADEWVLTAYIQSGLRWTSGIRPFDLLPWNVSYFIEPNSFVGINLFMLLLIVGKAVCVYLIIIDLELNPLFAFGTALLALLYPADTGVFYIGALTIHASVLTYLLAVWLLLRYWKVRARWLWIPIWGVSIVCLGLYEVAYPIFLLVPILLLFKQGGITRRVIQVSVLWWIVPLLGGIRAALVLLTQKSGLGYQSYLLSDDRSLGTIISSLWRMIRYTVIDSWVSALYQTIAPGGWSGFRNVLRTAQNNPYWGYIALGIVLLLIALWGLWRRSRSMEERVARRYLWMVVGGLVFIPAAFMLYLITGLRDAHMRTLLHASQGAAVVVSAGIWLIAGLLRRPRLLYALALVGLMSLGLTTQLVQHRNYAALGEQQLPFLRHMVSLVPEFKSGTTIIVVDQTLEHQLADTFSHLSSYLESSVQVIYSDATLKGIICYPQDDKPWGAYTETCRFEADHIALSSLIHPDQSLGYNQVVVLEYDSNGALTIIRDLSAYGLSAQAQADYQPGSRIDASAPLPLRAQTMLGMTNNQ